MVKDRLLVKREGDFTYPIVFRKDFSGLSQEIESLKSKGKKICVVTDENVAPLYLEQVKEQLRQGGKEVFAYILPPGEENKNLEQIQGIYEYLIQNHFDRKDMLAALGGGVAGDMTGFAAATYLRGIDFIQIPTTLLAQVDSSIGGKTGVDFKQYKNMVGAFHQPMLVYMNVSVLKSLSREQFACGMGEVLKHGLIRDLKYSRWLWENRKGILAREEELCQEMIYQSCVIKKTVVENDPTEKGERAVLNMGHTIGHAVEKLKDFSMAHGQCVSVGCMASAYLSRSRGRISDDEYQEIKTQLMAFGLPVKVEGLQRDEILKATKSDKKMEAGHIKFVLLECLGHAVVDTSVTDKELLEAIDSILLENSSGREQNRENNRKQGENRESQGQEA